MTALLEIQDLGVTYRLRDGDLHAVTGVSLELAPAEALGVVGESGCGKTTLAQAMLRLLPENARLAPATRIRLEGRDLTAVTADEFRREVRWKQISMVFQSAMNSLNPVVRVGDQIGRIARLHEPRLPRSAARDRCRALLDLVGLPEQVANRSPHELSGGMRQRVVIAMSLVASPRIVIADEATTALDVVVQAQILSELAALQRDRGLALLVVSHDMDVIAQVCDRVAVMYAGEIVELGPTRDVLRAPSHPYTAALLASLPRLTGPRQRLATLPGGPPQLTTLPTGCRFAPRCPIAEPVCATAPPLQTGPPGRATRCHFPADSRLAPALTGETP
jgi:oligopeptide/dipeptide ABC transporter ATP-binding protein